MRNTSDISYAAHYLSIPAFDDIGFSKLALHFLLQREQYVGLPLNHAIPSPFIDRGFLLAWSGFLLVWSVFLLV